MCRVEKYRPSCLDDLISHRDITSTSKGCMLLCVYCVMCTELGIMHVAYYMLHINLASSLVYSASKLKSLHSFKPGTSLQLLTGCL